MLYRSIFRSTLRAFAFWSALALAPFVAGCGEESSGTAAAESEESDITDVMQTDVERQAIGNCWLYAHASWIESMNLSATGTPFDVSQTYWTYWHWYDQIVKRHVDEIETGGFWDVANEIVLDRGVLAESKFVKQDGQGEMSTRQATALSAINRELKEGTLKTKPSRTDRLAVRKALDKAFGLPSSVKSQLTKAFGQDGSKTLRNGGTTKGTSILAPSEFKVRYPVGSGQGSTIKDTTLDVAIKEWRVASYPSWGSNSTRRSFQIRVQKALHDAAPVIITWDVDFNAMEGSDPVLRGSFNLTTLAKAGKPGRQGGHMTVLEDYEANTKEFGILKAGVTLDPNQEEDRKKLLAALDPSSEIRFFRVKNSWGAIRDDRASAPGFPGYHDLYMDYLNGPIAWCPDATSPTKESCKGQTVPFDSVVLPPGY
jgi:hypothetical protein